LIRTVDLFYVFPTQHIHYYYNRYHWNRKDISLYGIQSALKKAHEERSEDEEKKIIGNILEKVDLFQSEILEKSVAYSNSQGGRGGRGSQVHSSRRGTGIFSNNAAPESHPRGSGYRGVGRGNIRGNSNTGMGSERNRNNVLVREPRAPEDGHAFAPRGNVNRGNQSGRPAAQSQRSHK